MVQLERDRHGAFRCDAPCDVVQGHILYLRPACGCHRNVHYLAVEDGQRSTTPDIAGYDVRDARDGAGDRYYYDPNFEQLYQRSAARRGCNGAHNIILTYIRFCGGHRRSRRTRPMMCPSDGRL